MNKEIETYLEKYPEKIKEYFLEIVKLIDDNVTYSLEEKLWAGLPSFYYGDKFIRVIPFKNHLNIEAKGIANHLDDLKKYSLTPKLMLQIKLDEDIPINILKDIIKETLN